MSGVDHLPSEEYRKRAERSPGNRLCLRAHQHLVSACPECGKDWEELGPKLRELVHQELAAAPPLTPPPEPHPDDLSGSDEAVERLADQAASLRRQRRRAKKQLSELRLLPAARRPDRVRGAYRRFRSRLLAEFLIEEARSVVRNAPTEAESFASLVPLVLHWAEGEKHSSWAPTLVARATAHRANALRVAGELAGAERYFNRLDLRALADSAVRGEILSLEGSLRSDQRQFDAAEVVLQKAARAYAYANDPLGIAKVRVQQANLMQALDRTEDVLAMFENAYALLSADAPVTLVSAAVSGRVNALCDLDRPLEARRMLSSNLGVFEKFEGPFMAAHLRTLEGRISLGLEEYASAEEYLSSAASTMRLINRPYDAATVSLFLAEVFLAQGRTQELYGLAVTLTREFQKRGVKGEAMQALGLLNKAIAAEQLTATLLAEIRHKLIRAA